EARAVDEEVAGAGGRAGRQPPGAREARPEQADERERRGGADEGGEQALGQGADRPGGGGEAGQIHARRTRRGSRARSSEATRLKERLTLSAAGRTGDAGARPGHGDDGPGRAGE